MPKTNVLNFQIDYREIEGETDSENREEERAT